MTSMLKTLINRCLQIIPALFVVVTLTFVLTRMIPGDPARAVAGPQASVQDVEKLRESMGLNEPMLVQYKDYVLGVLQGDFGTSYSYNQPVLKLVAERIPNTLLLAIPSIAVALLIGMVIGVVSAVKQGSLFDYIFMILALIGVSMPIFWMGLMLVLTFSVRLGWLPALGMGTFENGLGDVIRHMVLPVSVCPPYQWQPLPESPVPVSWNPFQAIPYGPSEPEESGTPLLYGSTL